MTQKIEVHPDDDEETLASKKLAAETFNKLIDARKVLDDHEEQERLAKEKIEKLQKAKEDHE